MSLSSIETEVQSLKDKCIHCEKLIIKIGKDPWKHIHNHWNENCDNTVAYPAKKSVFSAIGTVDKCSGCGKYIYVVNSIPYRITAQLLLFTKEVGYGWKHVDSKSIGIDCQHSTKATPRKHKLDG